MAKKAAKKEAKKKETRHGKLRQGLVTTSIVINAELLAWAKRVAKNEDRSFANWAARLIARERLNADAPQPRPPARR